MKGRGNERRGAESNGELCNAVATGEVHLIKARAFTLHDEDVRRDHGRLPTEWRTHV